VGTGRSRASTDPQAAGTLPFERRRPGGSSRHAGYVRLGLLGIEGAALWSSVFELARRQFLLDRPPANEPSYRLCSHVFAAFPRIFQDTDALERALALLPTSVHVAWAREQLGKTLQT
jgi:hypothetical protein